MRFAAASWKLRVSYPSTLHPWDQKTTHPVENIHELALLHRSNHDRASLGVRRDVLTRDDPSRAGTTVRLLVELVEAVRLWVVLEHNDPSRVRPDDDVVCVGKRSQLPPSLPPTAPLERLHTLGSSCELERSQAPDCAKDLCLGDALELARLGICPKELDLGSSARDADLLRLGPGELTHACDGDGGGGQEGVVEEVHLQPAKSQLSREGSLPCRVSSRLTLLGPHRGAGIGRCAFP